MCGIVGYVGSKPAAPILVDGLARLEYRGYDSAGVAVLGSSELKVHKDAGRVRELEASLPKRFGGKLGIGHTRWATHGGPSKDNAHPHASGNERIAVVHNGIFDNAGALRAQLEESGVKLRSETDTEVLAHLIEQAEGDTLEDKVLASLRRIDGTYGIAVIDLDFPDRIVVARNGSPLILGIGDGEMHVASDAAALIRYTRQVVYLDDGELATVRADGYRTFTQDASPTTKTAKTVEWEADEYERGLHEHFMMKEIHEQSAAVERALRGRVDLRFHTAHLGGLNLDPREAREIRRVKILGCGSAYYAGQVGAQLIEELARIPADAEPASEFRYRNPVVQADTLYVAVSQSGETYDTLAAVQELRRKGGRVLGVVNAVGSAIARECDGGVYLHAGPEIAVASTKAYTSTAVVFALLALHLGRIHDLSPADGRRIADGLRALPGQIEEILRQEDRIASLAADLAKYHSMLFVGRVRGWPVAREGAQKLKEVSYVHAEAYPASELKHGPLALVSPELPTVAIVPDDELADKNRSTLGEIRARQGRGIKIGPRAVGEGAVVLPRNEPELAPILLTIPLQLIAYHAAVALGHDVDKPRNLAKSVTVD